VKKFFFLPHFAVRVTLTDGSGGTITSDLRQHVGKRSADAIESLILALACSGIAIDSEQFQAAVVVAVDAISNHDAQ